MQTELFKRAVAQNIASIKRQYEQYQRLVVPLLYPCNPLLIVNRAKTMQALFHDLEDLFPCGAFVIQESSDREELLEEGSSIYARLQTEITQLDRLQNAWSYEVQQALTEIRICFYYLLQAVEELDVTARENREGIEG